MSPNRPTKSLQSNMQGARLASHSTSSNFIASCLQEREQIFAIPYIFLRYQNTHRRLSKDFPRVSIRQSNSACPRWHKISVALNVATLEVSHHSPARRRNRKSAKSLASAWRA